MTRLAAAGTIDEHILRLQERKDREILSVMGEEGINRHIPTNRLMELFGNGVGEDDMGNAFIYPEDQGQRGPAMRVFGDDTEDCAMNTDQ